MKNNNFSESHIANNLKVILNFNYFQSSKMFADIGKEEINAFFNSKKPFEVVDQERKWITTWNHHLNHLKFFFRWLSNEHTKAESNRKRFSDWKTPDLIKVRMKRSERLDPIRKTIFLKEIDCRQLSIKNHQNETKLR